MSADCDAVPGPARPSRLRRVGSAVVRVETFTMPQASRYARHVHDEHQLTWTSRGVLIVVTDSGSWVLPAARALWIPGGIPHEAVATAATTIQSLYISPTASPVLWERPQPLLASALFAEMVEYLARPAVSGKRRDRAEAMLFDLLEPVEVVSIQAPVPFDERAARVAHELLKNPSDSRTLDEWADSVSISARTIARAFRDETGLGFDRWRTLARLQAALQELAHGEPVSNVARHVGYRTTSAFVAAFRRETGTTPHRYFQAPHGDRDVAG